MSERQIQVTGLKCEGCERAVETALTAVEGVEAASADHKTGTVRVTAGEAVSAEALAEAVRGAGYGTD